jgi:hypothetical protein
MKTQKHIATLATFFIFLALLTMGASLAYAVDTKEYPGSMCVKWGGDGIPVYDWSSIGNASPTSPLDLDCPIVHDAAGAISGWVRVTDYHYNLDISCTLVSVYRSDIDSSPQYKLSRTQYSSGSGPKVQQLPFGGVEAESIAHYYYSCSIPPAYNGSVSYIHTYQIVERTD